MVLLPVVATLVLSLIHAGVAGAERWQRPLERGTVVREFDFDGRDPFARGARRGLRIAGRPGDPVTAPCAGRVIFAGSVPRLGQGVTLRCGRLVATEFGLEPATARRGAVVAAGAQVGLLGVRGTLLLGARDAGSRWGYRDPLALLGAPKRPPLIAPGPRLRREPPPLSPPGARSQETAPDFGTARAPAAAWLGLAAVGAGVGLGTALRYRTARRAPRAPQPARANARR